MSTRPTSDRLRETLFNIISPDVRDAVVLDLFAGTGALGIEALSRGAEHCTFIDNRKQAVDVIRHNISGCSLDTQTRVFSWDITRNLNCLKKSSNPFSLVFIDPPYYRNMVTGTLQNLLEMNVLKKNATIVIEHGSDETITIPKSPLTLDECRTYGKTSVTFCTYYLSGSDT